MDRILGFRFHPNKGFKLYWDLAIILLSVYNSFLIPLQFAIPKNVNSEIIEVFDTVIDYIFICDIFINFRTIYVCPKTESDICNQSRIAWNYIKGRLTIDILASFPLEILVKIFTSKEIDSGTSNLFSMFKLTRLFRLGRMIHYFSINQEFKFGMKML